MRNVAPKPEILNRVFILHVVEKWSVGDTHESGFLSSEKGNMWYQKLVRVSVDTIFSYAKIIRAK